MSAWPGKYVIGLTGNIATGKSVVRKMLEHLGAYGIDADALGHRAIANGAPGYQPVIETFGKWILAADGQIDRSRLARIVFSDPYALERLEKLVHPLVRQAIDLLVRSVPHRVVVVEAIKLLGGPLRPACDSIWVTYAPPEVQLSRLMEKRGMSFENASLRIKAQPPQESKLAAANVVIHNQGTFEDTWEKVYAAWVENILDAGEVPLVPSTTVKGELVVERARPRQAEEISVFIARVSGGRQNPGRADIMASFGEKAYLLLKQDGVLVGLIGWQVENLVARTADIYLEPGYPLEQAMTALLEAVEGASRELQCEISLLFLPPHIAKQTSLWNTLGYEAKSVQDLGVRAWQEAAQESRPPGTIMLVKQLRKDRILQPI